MRNRVFVAFFVVLVMAFAVHSVSEAAGVEFAVGGWHQNPGGDISYRALVPNDTLDLDRDLRYDEELRLMGRLKVDVPGPWPNIYLMGTAMNFEGTGRKTVTFKFGDRTFAANADYTSNVDLNHFDLALYWTLPGVKRATDDKFGLELGLDVRVVDFEAEVRQPSTGLSDSESVTLPLPMIYVGAQLDPVEWLAFEGEFRGIAFDNDHMYDLIGRVKFRPKGPLFIAAGWRFEDVDIDEDDVRANVSFSGPFAEVGAEF